MKFSTMGCSMDKNGQENKLYFLHRVESEYNII